MAKQPAVLVIHRYLPHHRHHIEATVNRLAARGMRVEHCHITEVVPYLDGKRLTALDASGRPLDRFNVAYFVGVSGGSTLDRLRALRAAGVRVVNDPDAIARVSDKHVCSVMLAEAGVPVPAHLLLSSQKETKRAAVRMLGPRLILKPKAGSLGRDVALIQNPGVLDRVRTKDDTIAQQYLPDAARGDLRVFVVGGVVVASMLRVPARGEHRANLSRGGKGLYHDATDREVEVALAAFEASGLDFAGVDLVPTVDGPMVIEINSRPGHKIAEITDTKTKDAVADEVARIAREEVRRKRDDA